MGRSAGIDALFTSEGRKAGESIANELQTEGAGELGMEVTVLGNRELPSCLSYTEGAGRYRPWCIGLTALLTHSLCAALYSTGCDMPGKQKSRKARQSRGWQESKFH